MRLNILIGGKAGQGINKISEIVAKVMNSYGYFTFNYRDYPSLIRGGHNYNILSISDKRVGSYESMLDGIIAMDDNTVKLHKKILKKDGFVITPKGFENLGRNLNVAQSGALIKVFGLPKELLINEIEEQFHNPDSNKAGELGYNSQQNKYGLKRLPNVITKMVGNVGIAKGAIDSGINLYIAYPMTPSTGVLHALAGEQEKHGFMVFQPENEISVVNSALGASFAGAKTMIGSSGGGYDLMTEGLSMQGMSEIPLVVYLSARPGPGSGIPTYHIQGDLDIALRGGHGEFPRIVVMPGDPIEAQEKTNECFYLSEKYGMLSIILGDKHVAESEFSTSNTAKKPIKVKVKRDLPLIDGIVKASSYEHDKDGNTTESAKWAKLNADNRTKKYDRAKEEISKKFEMIKIHGNPESKNIIVGSGSTKGVILDAIEGLDYKFLQVLYAKPISNEIKQHLQSAAKVILIEQNVTGQLGRLIREKTGISIANRILKYDGLPFESDKLRADIQQF
ncbi:hypothetical protein GOV14_05795 [Candidatus Pacearchaeota archaeon]|nr:hypothetical protein [Candidatus Pacearchaeota archaeon]